MSDTFPGQVEALRVENTVGGTCNLNGNTLNCTLSPRSGQPATAVVQVRAGTLAPGATVVNSASASVNGTNTRASDSNTLRVPGTAAEPTAVPPTAIAPTAVPPTAVPPTAVPPTAVPPTEVPPPPAAEEPAPAQEPAPAPRAPRPPANDQDPTATISPFLPVTVVPTAGSPVPSSTPAPPTQTVAPSPTGTSAPATATSPAAAPVTATPAKALPTKAPPATTVPTEAPVAKPNPTATTPARQVAAKPSATAQPAAPAPAQPTRVPDEPTKAPPPPRAATTVPTSAAPAATAEPTVPASTATTAPTLAPVTTPEAAGVAANSVSIRFNKQSDWGQITAGETLVYTITLQHAGGAAGGSSPLLPGEDAGVKVGALEASTPITDVLILDELNASLEPLEVRAVGLEIQRDGQRVQATRPRMDAGETVKLVIEARVRADTTLAAIQNQASLRYAGLTDAINSNVTEVQIVAKAQPTATAAPEAPTTAPTSQPAGVADGEPADLGAALPNTSGGSLPLGGVLLLGLTLMLHSVRAHRARVRI